MIRVVTEASTGCPTDTAYGETAAADRDRAARRRVEAPPTLTAVTMIASAPDWSPGLKFVGLATDKIFHWGPVVSAERRGKQTQHAAERSS